MTYNYYRSPQEIVNEEIQNEKTRIPQINSNPLLRNKLTYWQRKQNEQRKNMKSAKANYDTEEKKREKEARKIKSKYCVSKYKVTCSTCGQGFRTKKELANHTEYYKKNQQRWGGNTCYSSTTVNARLSRVTTEKKKKNMCYDSDSDTSYDKIIANIEIIVNMIKDRMKLLTNRCDKCRNTFSSASLKSMSCKYDHKLCADCHGDESKCAFCKIHCRISHAKDNDLEAAAKIRSASTRFKPQTQIQIQPKVCYKPAKPSRPACPEEDPEYCNICFDVCKGAIFNLDCGGKHSMCLSCTNEIVRQSYQSPKCPFCRRRFTAPSI
jgi:hypothetical protein